MFTRHMTLTKDCSLAEEKEHEGKERNKRNKSAQFLN